MSYFFQNNSKREASPKIEVDWDEKHFFDLALHF